MANNMRYSPKEIDEMRDALLEALNVAVGASFDGPTVEAMLQTYMIGGSPSAHILTHLQEKAKGGSNVG